MSRYQYVFWSIAAVLIGSTVVVGVVDRPAVTSASAARSAPATPAAPPPASVPVVGMPAPVLPNPKLASALKVTKVIDGDTFEVSDGSRVRVLGIDSCEMSTPAGRDAKNTAETWLTDKMVDLTAEPGVDRDRYGRLLRYVDIQVGNSTYWQDFGKQMVTYGHTGIYEGKNDASPAYVAGLRAADTDGRDCSDAGGYANIPPTEDHYVPVPDSNDDGDGGKSRHCRRHWYC